MEQVARLQRVEAYNREKQLQKIEDDTRRLAEMNHKKYLLQQDKIAFKKEQVRMNIAFKKEQVQRTGKKEQVRKYRLKKNRF